MTNPVLELNQSGEKLRYVFGQDHFTAYNKGVAPIKIGVNNPLFNTFLRMCLIRGKSPSEPITRRTRLNRFQWNRNGVSRYNHTTGDDYVCGPTTDFAFQVARGLVKNYGN